MNDHIYLGMAVSLQFGELDEEQYVGWTCKTNQGETYGNFFDEFYE